MWACVSACRYVCVDVCVYMCCLFFYWYESVSVLDEFVACQSTSPSKVVVYPFCPLCCIDLARLISLLWLSFSDSGFLHSSLYVSLCLLFCLSVIIFRLCLHALFSVPLSASIIVPLSVSLSLPHYPPHCLLDCLALCAFVKTRQHRTIVCVRFCLIPCLHRAIRVKWRTGCEWMLACPVWYSSCSSSDGYSAGGSVTCQAKEAVVRSDWPMCIH